MVSYPAAAISNELAGAKDGDARWVVAGGVGVGVGVGVSRLRSTAGRDRVSGGTDPPAEERGTQPEELGERLDWTPKWWSWASSCSDAGGAYGEHIASDVVRKEGPNVLWLVGMEPKRANGLMNIYRGILIKIKLFSTLFALCKAW